MPGGTTVPYKKTKHKTFNAFCIKRFSGQYQIQSRNCGSTNWGATVLGKPGSKTVILLSDEVVWGTQYGEKNKCTLIRKTHFNMQKNIPDSSQHEDLKSKKRLRAFLS